MKEVPIVDMSLLQMCKNFVGGKEISRIEIINKEGIVLNTYDYSKSTGDHIPSVIFSMSDILGNSNSMVSNHNTTQKVNEFPGLL